MFINIVLLYYIGKESSEEKKLNQTMAVLGKQPGKQPRDAGEG